jgi:Na+-transporting NADH:ubiquinone oxidoreductase subunit A
MSVHRIKKGLTLPLSGAPAQEISGGRAVKAVALVADDFPGLKPGMLVEVGDSVARGQPLLEDRKIPGVRHTAPGAGKVIAINRGARRALQSVVIELSEAERSAHPGAAEQQEFQSPGGSASQLSNTEVRALLVESGLWTAFRRRPFSKVPRPESMPDAIFVTAMDTQPLAPAPEVVLADRADDFDRGLQLIAKLTDGKTFLCVSAGSNIPKRVTAPVSVEEFSGPHPAGTAGVHIHTIMPVSRSRTVWTVGYQDVVAIGKLFETGRLDMSRVISMAGPPVRDPRLVTTRIGARVSDLTAGETDHADVRWISGSVLSGKATTEEPFDYMGRYDVQLSALVEGREREFMGWAGPGATKFSVIPVFFSRLLRTTRFDLTTTTHGSPRAMVPIGLYERVMPMDLLPTFLLRSLIVGDIERAEELGCLELDEEDLALCTFVDPGKTDFGPILRLNLELIEKEG